MDEEFDVDNLIRDEKEKERQKVYFKDLFHRIYFMFSIEIHTKRSLRSSSSSFNRRIQGRSTSDLNFKRQKNSTR